MQDFDWLTLTVAQETALPGANGAPATGTTGADARPLPPAGGGNAPSGFGPGFMYIVVLMILGMLVLSMLSTRREKKRRDAMINAIKKHDRVQTIGGVIGSVVEVKPDYVILKVDESSNTRITFARSAIQQVLNVSPENLTAGKTESAK